jgi:hypothetical protein
LLLGQARADRGGDIRRQLDDASHAACVERASAICDVAEGAIPLNGADARFCAFRLLLAMPWPEGALGRADAVNAPALPLARALSALFTSTRAPNHFFRGAVNIWVRWAGRGCASILAAWASGVQRAWVDAGGSNEPGACVLLAQPIPTMPARLTALCGWDNHAAAAPGPAWIDIDDSSD